eukprot:COSAG02_NODE_278_length_25916_cov_19.826432_10_plen_277_part_00
MRVLRLDSRAPPRSGRQRSILREGRSGTTPTSWTATAAAATTAAAAVSTSARTRQLSLHVRDRRAQWRADHDQCHSLCSSDRGGPLPHASVRRVLQQVCLHPICARLCSTVGSLPQQNIGRHVRPQRVSMARQYLRRNRWPKLHLVARIPDDPVKMSNTIGTISFAAAGPNSRTTLLFINFKDNSRLDQEGFAPFGTVVGAAGMATAVAIHNPTPSAQHTHPVPTAERYDSGLPCIRLRVWLSTRGSCRNQIIRRASTRNSTKTVETAGSDRNIQA